MEVHPDRVNRIGTDSSGRLVYEAEINGTPTRVAKIDVDPFGNGDDRWYPEKMAKELAVMREKVREGDGPLTLSNVWTSLITKGGGMFFISRELGLAGSRIAASKAHWSHFLPVAGARGRVMVKMMEMARNPRGQAIQGVMERLGASGERFSEKFEPTIVDETRMGKLKKVAGKVWDFEEDLMFGRNGAENLIRRVMTETAISLEIGDAAAPVLADVDSGKLGELEAAEKIMSMMSSGQKTRVTKFINDTLGHANKEARTAWMNKAQKWFPWITVNASQIPAGFRRLLTANVDWKQAVRVGRNNPAKAAALVAGGMMSGPIGMFLLGNVLNYLLNGHGMQDNDEKRRTQVKLGDGVYWGIDEELQRTMRISGLRQAASGQVGSFGEYPSVLKDEAFRQLTYMVLPWLRLTSERGGASVPAWYAQRTAEEIQRNGFTKEAVTQGVIQDLQQNLVPFPGVQFSGAKEKKDAAIDDAVAALRKKDTNAYLKIARDKKLTAQDTQNAREQARYPDDRAYKISNMTVQNALKEFRGMSVADKDKYRTYVNRKVLNSELGAAERRAALTELRK
jgi:hypothetical protein